MAVSKDRPITPFQKAILDEYYSNGFDSMAAYCKVKGIDEPSDNDKRVSIHNIVHLAKKGNPEYIARIEAKNDKKHGKMRDKLVKKLEDVATTYEQLVTIALQDELTPEDSAKFKRLKSIMSTKDYNKAVELIAKLTGSFEPEKREVSNTFTVSWGDAPKLQQNTKPIIDVDHTDVDEETS